MTSIQLHVKKKDPDRVGGDVLKPSKLQILRIYLFCFFFKSLLATLFFFLVFAFCFLFSCLCFLFQCLFGKERTTTVVGGFLFSVCIPVCVLCICLM